MSDQEARLFKAAGAVRAEAKRVRRLADARAGRDESLRAYAVKLDEDALAFERQVLRLRQLTPVNFNA